MRTFEKTKENQEEWFIAKLTANDSKIDETNVKEILLKENIIWEI